MPSATTRAASARQGTGGSVEAAAAVPTSTGQTAATRVRGRAPRSQTFIATRSGPAGELGEVGTALLAEGVAALLGLLGHVVEQGGVAGKLLDAGQAVGVGVEAGLEQPQRQRALGEDLAAPLDR